MLGGLYFTIRTKFVQFRLLKEQFHAVMEKPTDGKGVSSFQALMVSTASRVGTGNIIGVSMALCMGGFGSVFWMWLNFRVFSNRFLQVHLISKQSLAASLGKFGLIFITVAMVLFAGYSYFE